LCATVATLIFVPAVFSLLHRRHDPSAVQQPAASKAESMQA
jgi:hypothetical protein